MVLIKYKQEEYKYSLEIANNKIGALSEKFLMSGDTMCKDKILFELEIAQRARRGLKILSVSASEVDTYNIDRLISENEEVCRFMEKFEVGRMIRFTNFLVAEKAPVEDIKSGEQVDSKQKCYQSLRIRACQNLLEEAALICCDKLDIGEFVKDDYHTFNDEFKGMVYMAAIQQMLMDI